ncbi:unnamed protein product [Echinostoma caproni]|uniref:G_PROTEIN_RECEP_F2_4 domain-containing protein n=1 Tax=Echinostoma caproni TaxID=27848 RepID=A0A183ACY8_9TREM|nr:unnamed protein product [Echinostoma caproni]
MWLKRYPLKMSEHENFGNTLQRFASNARALREVDPEYFLGLTSVFTDERLKDEIQSHTEEERQQMANRLLDTLTQTLDSDMEIHIHPTTEHLVPPDVQLHAVVTDDELDRPSYPVTQLKPTTTTVRAPPDTSQKPVSALHKRMPAYRQTAQMNQSDGGKTSLTIKPDSDLSVTEDQIVAILPASKLKETSVTEDPRLEEVSGRHLVGEADQAEKPALVQSDVLLIDTNNLDSTYHISMNLTKKPMSSVTCHQLQHSVDKKYSQWSDELCETIVVGLHYECRCRPRERGTFAIALVYWIGNAEIPPEHEYVITLVNYIFTSITIVALLLFLIFTRFVGVFRLDQFNIAFCLMISAIVSLIIPFVTNKQPVGCVILAIAVCFFPLAAFSWKFIFGLNTLILIVAPQSRYHDLVSRHRHCVPLVWIGYIIPAVIVGAWFGYAEKVHTQKL